MVDTGGHHATTDAMGGKVVGHGFCSLHVWWLSSLPCRVDLFCCLAVLLFFIRRCPEGGNQIRPSELLLSVLICIALDCENLL
jgi:hypothetical protein